MSTVKNHRDDIKNIVLDRRFTDSFIDQQINKAIRHVTDRVLLPVLESSDTIDTEVGNPYVPQPTNFGRNLYGAASIHGDITVVSSLSILREEFPLFDVQNEIGSVEMACIAGSDIAIHPIPSDVTILTFFFYKHPTILTEDQDVSIYIEAEEDQENLIQNYVAWKLYKLIEKGTKDPMTNTRYYKNAFLEALTDFKGKFIQGQSRPRPVRFDDKC